jgi:hypothetical protein
VVATVVTKKVALTASSALGCCADRLVAGQPVESGG